MVPLAPKLRPATMQHVMRAFAKLQLDEEAAAVDGEDDGVDGFVVVLQLAAPVPRGFELLG